MLNTHQQIVSNFPRLQPETDDRELRARLAQAAAELGIPTTLTPFAVCPHNSRHRMPADSLPAHELRCSSRPPSPPPRTQANPYVSYTHACLLTVYSLWDTIPDHHAQLSEDMLPGNDVLSEWLSRSLLETSIEDRDSVQDIVRSY